MTISLTDLPTQEENKQGTSLKKSREFFSKIRVIYADTDKMGHVYHSRYLHYFEIGRNEMLREAGFTYKELEENNIYLPVLESHLNYFKPAYFDDLLTIVTRVELDSKKPLRFTSFSGIYRNDELLTSGYTAHIFANESGKPSRPCKKMYSELISELFS